jgi:hypothetical protein
MPAFRRHGILVYFAAWTKHIGLYPPISGDKTLERAVVRDAGPKGNLLTPLRGPHETAGWNIRRGGDCPDSAAGTIHQGWSPEQKS